MVKGQLTTSEINIAHLPRWGLQQSNTLLFDSCEPQRAWVIFISEVIYLSNNCHFLTKELLKTVYSLDMQMGAFIFCNMCHYAFIARVFNILSAIILANG
jgi:hypothetical protein